VCECVLSVNVCFEGCAAYVRVKKCVCMREGGRECARLFGGLSAYVFAGIYVCICESPDISTEVLVCA